MSDVTEAPTQAEIAESLLGDPAEAQQPIEQPETEQQAETLEVESPDVEQAETEQVEEAADDWLPTEQEKVFPDEVLSRYAERYGLKEHDLANPQIRQLVVDKINTDIYAQQLRESQEQAAVEEPAPRVEEPTPAAQPQITREQHFQNLARVVQERTDPEVAKAFHNEFLGLWKLPEAEQPLALAQVTSKYMLNLVNTFLPDMLKAQLSTQLGQAFPGFGEMYERSSYAMAWDRVRNSDPQFASLPAYGTKEFSSQLREASNRIPGFDEMQFTDGHGKPLSAQDNAMRKYTMLAQIAAGQSVDPQTQQLLQRAAQAGAKNARRAEVRRSAGNLGSGQSKAASGQRGSSKFQTNDDLFDDETMALYQREHGRL